MNFLINYDLCDIAKNHNIVHQAAEQDKEVENLMEAKWFGKVGLFDGINDAACGIGHAAQRGEHQRPNRHTGKGGDVNQNGPAH